jgi:hypothetical protein
MKNLLNFTIILIIFFFGNFVFAQDNTLSVYGPSDINYKTNPTNPNPGETTTITLSSYSVDINRSNIQWLINGSVKKSGIGLKTYEFQAPSSDTNMTITANVSIADKTTIQKQIIISTKSVDVLWEALDSYTPPFYKGKAMPSSESRIKVSAIPNKNDITTYVTKWSLNSNILGGGANTNKMSIEYRNSYLNDTDEITLEIGDLSGSIGSKKISYIPIISPEILFYKIDGVLGTLYNKNLNNMIDMNTNSISLSAEPYYFSPKNIRSGQLDFSWKVNGETIPTPKKKNILNLELSDNKNGRADIYLGIESVTKLMLSQNIKVPVNINIK